MGAIWGDEFCSAIQLVQTGHYLTELWECQARKWPEWITSEQEVCADDGHSSWNHDPFIILRSHHG